MPENTNSDLLREMSQARRTQKKGKKTFYWLRGKDNTQVEHKQAYNHSLSCYLTACKLNLRGKNQQSWKHQQYWEVHCIAVVVQEPQTAQE